MATQYESENAQLHEQFDGIGTQRDLAGGDLKTGTYEDKEDARSSSGHSNHGPTPDGEEPNAEEKASLRRIGEWLPASAWLVAMVELCERFTYYGISGLFQNYATNPYNHSLGAPGLDLGHQAATGLSLFFQFFCYVTPILGAIIADQYLGKYNTIVIFVVVYIIGLLILFITSLPFSLSQGSPGVGGYATALVIIGLGTGGIKSNVAPLIADQYQRRKMAVRTEPSGERIIIDPAITIQRIYMIFYLCINVGSLSLIGTVYMEKYLGFWTAYLLGLCVFLVGFGILIFGRKAYVVRPPTGSIITNAFRAMGQMIKARNTDAPKPSYQLAHGKTVTTRWDDQFINELKRALIACKVFVFFPVFWVAYGQFSNNFVYQASEMRLHGIPNDLMQNFDPIAIIVFIPIMDRFVYPLLRKYRINFRPISRITVGFWVAALAMMYASIVQHLIYTTGPCYDAPLVCKAAVQPDGQILGNNVHVAVQTPAYMLIGISEIFISVSGLEYAYTKAPPSMKSFVQSMYLFTNAVGSALGEAIVVVAVDPKFVWFYAGVAIACFVTGAIFFAIFRHLNAQEESLNEIDANDPFASNRNMDANRQHDIEAEQVGAGKN